MAKALRSITGSENTIWTVRCMNDLGQPVDFTNVYTLTFSMWLVGHPNTLKIDHAAATFDPDQVNHMGEVTYMATAANLNAAGNYQGVIEGTWTTIPETIKKWLVDVVIKQGGS